MMRRLHLRPPSAAERAEVRRWERSGKTALYLRARTLLLAADSGLTGADAARLLGLHPNTTRRWLHRFSKGGLAALAPGRRVGRKKEFGDDVAEAVIALLHEPPEAHGCSSSRWTLGDVAAALAREGVVEKISIETVRRLLRGRRRSWQRAKEWITSPDPEYAVKKSGATG